MLSKDDLIKGRTFILKLMDAAGEAAYWVASLRGEVASRWYDVYRRSDWNVLRTHGGEVFIQRVPEAEAEHVRKSQHCVVIHTPEVKAEEINSSQPKTKPLQPGWENDGGSLAPVAAGGADQAAPQNPSSGA